MRCLLFALFLFSLTACKNKPTTSPATTAATDSLTAAEDSEFVETVKDIPVPGK